MLAVENMNRFPYPSMETYAPMHYAGYMPAITTLPKPAPRSRPPPKASRVRLTLPKHPDPEDPKPTRQSKRAGPDYQTARAKRAEKKAKAYNDTLEGLSTSEGPSTAGLRTRKRAENEIGRIMRSVNKTIEEAAAGGCPPPPPPSGGLNDDDEETPEPIERKPLKIKIPKAAVVNFRNKVREMDELTSLLGGACAVQENYDIDSLTRVTERSLHVGGCDEKQAKRVCFEEDLQPKPSPMRQMEIEVETSMFLAEMEEQLGMKKARPSVAAVPLAQPVAGSSQSAVDARAMTVDAMVIDDQSMVVDVDAKSARKAAYREARKQARREKQASKKRDVQNRRTLRALEGQQQALDDVLLDVPSDRVLPVEERTVELGEASRYLVEDTADYNVVGPRRHRLAGRMNASPYGAALAEKRMKRKY